MRSIFHHRNITVAYDGAGGTFEEAGSFWGARTAHIHNNVSLEANSSRILKKKQMLRGLCGPSLLFAIQLNSFRFVDWPAKNSEDWE